jgi:hypothetical protein
VGQGIIQRQTFSINLEAYTGVWEYVAGQETFRINLKIGIKDTKVSYGTCLIGDYYYTKNNSFIDNNWNPNIPAIYNDLSRETITIYASNGKSGSVSRVNSNDLYMYFRDKQMKKRTASGKIKLISPTQIQWILEDDEGDIDDWVEEGFSVPTNVIMTKK